MDAGKRKFLFVSLSGLIGDIAWQVAKEGHEVKYFIEDESERDIADGFVPKVDDWERERGWADVIVFDDTLGQGGKAQALRRDGKLVVGGTPYTDRLEDDRSFGQEELKKAGVNILPYRGVRQLRRRDRLREKQSRALRHQAQRRGRQRQAAPVRGRRGRRRGRDPRARCLQEIVSPTRSRCSSCSAASPASKSRSARSSTARSSSPRSTSTSSTRSSSPETSAPPPARWAR